MGVVRSSFRGLFRDFYVVLAIFQEHAILGHSLVWEFTPEHSSRLILLHKGC